MSEKEQEGKRSRRAGSLIGLLVAARALREALRRPRSLPAPPPQSDEDPRRRDVPANPRVETAVALLLLGAAVFALGFTAAVHRRRAQPAAARHRIGGALAQLSAAAIIAGKARRAAGDRRRGARRAAEGTRGRERARDHRVRRAGHHPAQAAHRRSGTRRRRARHRRGDAAGVAGPAADRRPRNALAPRRAPRRRQGQPLQR